MEANNGIDRFSTNGAIVLHVPVVTTGHAHVLVTARIVGRLD